MEEADHDLLASTGRAVDQDRDAAAGEARGERQHRQALPVQRRRGTRANDAGEQGRQRGVVALGKGQGKTPGSRIAHDAQLGAGLQHDAGLPRVGRRRLARDADDHVSSDAEPGDDLPARAANAALALTAPPCLGRSIGALPALLPLAAILCRGLLTISSPPAARWDRQATSAAPRRSFSACICGLKRRRRAPFLLSPADATSHRDRGCTPFRFIFWQEDRSHGSHQHQPERR